PGEDEPEQRRGRARARRRRSRQPAADHEPDNREGGVDERAVRRSPGAFRGERPQRRGARPGDEPEQEAEERAREAIDANRRREPDERGAGRERRRRERERADPDEPRVVAVREEERAEDRDHGRRGSRETGAGDPFSRDAHR